MADLDRPAARRTWNLCAGLGGTILLFSVYLFAVFPADGAGYDQGYGAPIYAFEMARSVEDLWKVFGPPSDPQHAARIAAMDLGNRWDYLFMLLYGGFIVMFFRAAGIERADRRWRWGAALGVLAASSDAIENVILLNLTTDLAHAPNIEWLAFPVWTKFGALIGAAALAGLCIRESGGWFVKLLGGTVLVSAACCLLGVVSPSRFGWILGTGLGVCWTIQWLHAAHRGRTPKR